jgi:chromate transporter
LTNEVRNEHTAPQAHPDAQPGTSPRAGSAAEVLGAFLKLGLTSFGGPVAHLGYFRAEFVQRRRWLDDRSFTDLVALCQFLPGPASSQVGMGLGLARAGWLGALAAWCGFTLPSAFLLIAFAYGIAHWGALAGSGAVHGLKVAAVAVVAQAVWGMAKNLCPDRERAAIAVVAALLVLALPTALSQVIAIALAGLVGWRLLKLPHQHAVAHQGFGVSRTAGAVALTLFFVLLVALPLVALTTQSALWKVVEGFYRAGALVFGGGHVVLSLLQASVVPAGVVSNEQFLAGYGAAQAVPGPLFTFAAYLGAVMHGPFSGWMGGLALLLVIFVPAALLVVGALPFWDALRQRDAVQSAMAGVNAAVVGILLAALYDPVWTSAIRGRADFATALAAFALLLYARVSPLVVVLLAAVAGWAFLA